MIKFYTAIFTEKSTGKVLYRLNYKPLVDKRESEEDNRRMNKFLWEKEKAVRLAQIIKDRFFDKNEIEIRDYEGVL